MPDGLQALSDLSVTVYGLPAVYSGRLALKRSELLRRIGSAARDRRLAWNLRRQGAQHEIWELDGLDVPIPRHREINEKLARAIMADLSVKLGEGWWNQR